MEQIQMKVGTMKKNIVEKENEAPEVTYTMNAKSIIGDEKSRISLSRKMVPFGFESGQLITVTVEEVQTKKE